MTKKISRKEKDEAYKLMENEQLVFVLRDKNAIKKMCEFVKKKNGELYGREEFEFIETDFDRDLIVAAVPKLGKKQLGVFAARDFAEGEIIAVYRGEDLWGFLPNEELERKIDNCDESGDYFWHIVGKNGGMAIDSRIKGSVARFVNDSLQRNIIVETDEDGVRYVAKRKIKFGEEITTCYGKQFFDETNPRVEYSPQNLQTILSELFAQKNSEAFSLIPIDNMGELVNFLGLLGWADEKETVNSTKNYTAESELMPDIRANTNPKLYLKNDQPLIFDLSRDTDFKPKPNFKSSKPGGIHQLQHILQIKLERTSQFKLFAAPTRIQEGQHRFSLFAGQHIKKHETVCLIKGEKKTKKEIEADKNLNMNLLFQINQTTHLYCANFGSEALFVQGVKRDTQANVKLLFKGASPSYVATTDIEPGTEIVAFYGDAYAHTSTKETLESVLYDFNQNQLQWDAWLTKGNTYTITFLPHIMTPGRDLVDEPESSTPIQTPTSVTQELRVEDDVYDYDDEDSIKVEDTKEAIDEHGSFLKTSEKQPSPLLQKFNFRERNFLPNWQPTHFQKNKNKVAPQETPEEILSLSDSKQCKKQRFL